MDIYFTNKEVYQMLKSKMEGLADKYLVGVGTDHNNCPKAIFYVGTMSLDGWTLEEYCDVVIKTRDLIWDWATSMFDKDATLEISLIDVDTNNGELTWRVAECSDDYCCDECDGDCDDE